MACPSAKTPEGKKIIDTLRIRIARLEDQVARSGPTRQSMAFAAPPSQSTTSLSSSQGSGTLGGLLNVYA